MRDRRSGTLQRSANALRNLVSGSLRDPKLISEIRQVTWHSLPNPGRQVKKETCETEAREMNGNFQGMNGGKTEFSPCSAPASSGVLPPQNMLWKRSTQPLAAAVA